MPRLNLPLAAVLLVAAVPSALCQVSSMKKPPSSPRNRHYQGNRAPLAPRPLIKLPVGSIWAEGWLKTQLSLMAEGMTGRLTEISPWCRFEGSAWASSRGEGAHGWEEMPYWLKGYISLGHLLGDSRILAESRRWVEAMLASQRPDGYFGPESNKTDPDLWPNMIALYALRTHYEATRDRRVLDLMLRYFRWFQALPLHRILPGSWMKIRGADNLDILHWLYNQTGERWLLDAARVNYERTADWISGLPTWHGVNICQSFRGPAQYSQQTGDARYLHATERIYDTVMNLYGQVPGGMFGADENARPGYNGPRQAAETCSIVEIIYSHALLAAITGDAKWGDRSEEVAFNSLPPSMTPDLKALHYLTAPNQVQLDRRDKSPMIQNGGDMFSYSPFEQYRCCQHNVAMGWPYFTEHLWMATGGNGLAAVLYAPAAITARVGDGATATVRVITDYPFSDEITMKFSLDRGAKFPLTLRVPEWCARPSVRLNGSDQPIKGEPRGWLVVDRTWADGDTLTLTLPMTIQVREWTKNRRTVSVHRGPLAYSLQIGERWAPYGRNPAWPSFEVFPTTPWNYGLVLDANLSPDGLQFEQRPGPLAAQPFTPDAAPQRILAKARRIPAWELEENGLIGEVAPGPIRSTEPDETVTLIPMGCARLRVSAFPRIADAPEGKEWRSTAISAAASHVNPGDTLDALTDGVEPASSSDQSIPRFTWWDHTGTREWVELAFSRPTKISSVHVYWFDDERAGGQCRAPAQWRLLYWDGGQWQPVDAREGFGTERDRYNTVRFAEVNTTRLRIEAQLRPGFSAGILEWKVP